MFVSETAPFSAADRFVSMIDALCTVIVSGLAAGMPGPQVIGIWDRLTRILTRFAAILARPIRPRSIAPRALPPRPPTMRQPTQPRPFKSCRLPTGYGWLLRRIPAASPFAAELQRLVGDPQMAALLQANPGMVRLLRPLCRMLGVQQPPDQRAPHPKPAAPPTPETPMTGTQPPETQPPAPHPPEPAWRPDPYPPDLTPRPA